MNQLIKEVFEKIYSSEYKLIKLWEIKKLNHHGYAISHGSDGIIVEFSVSDTVIYEASSKGDLLSHEHNIELWLKFYRALEKLLKEAF